mmetsp:Transcript_30246/g.87167  ORF Transcript_30246/g.87167 Transcript_30246/m.87167 type:complete len:480 (+) Transcript_30246:95-1534(+)|eukprot:CAMPEP_0176048300 /NCGR_PEP_ID=MMETSP0120_2-20121206/23992_1 /TAXON_ID=160619 /ORGANISM="Kryptoperidinium foliaceum, Strain CCMP 1326" /LENGTH=479 /DNA_ID=CAMNT_0017381717 /DNA_START=425 /DNA_END=1864 /DNA_ORIENTATION=+
MSAPAPVPDPTAAVPAVAPTVSHEDGAVATAAAVAAANVAPAPGAPPPDAIAKKVVASSATSPSSKASKSKKKKAQVAVTMATAPAGQAGPQGENTGRWTAEEHRLFLQGLDQHGKGWKKIASLIKSRTVVQIRTHAQKYFQKLAKARQNGDEGEVSMEGRGGPTSVPSVTNSAAQSSKRRRQTSGTKRKAIQSVVASAQRQGKKMATGGKAPLPAVAPALAPYVLPQHPPAPDAASAPTAISGPILEDSLFRFLTPAPVASSETQVNEVARQAGANPITVPTEQHGYTPSGGEISPTGVADFALYPSWTDAKDTPSWYTKGSDVDALLDVADTLDWLTDPGDNLIENYEPENEEMDEANTELPDPSSDKPVDTLSQSPSVNNLSMNTLPRVDSHAGVEVPPLPSLFEGSSNDVDEEVEVDDVPAAKLSQHQLAPSTSSNTIDEHLKVFENQHDLEHDFVSSMLENAGESSENLAELNQ